jgi:Na+/melibiose symporter-like transporter
VKVAESSDRLSRKVLGAFSAPAFSQSFIHGPALSVLQGIYAKFFGLGLEQIALVIFITRIFDGVTDPIIGYLSDQYRIRRGSRKPWLMAGSIITVLACWFLYVPFGEVSMASFLFWFLLANLGWTIAEVPYGAWLAELSEDYDERARIASWRGVSRYLGLMAFFGLPLAAQRFIGTTEFIPETLRWASVFAIVAVLSTAALAVLLVPDGTASLRQTGPTLREAARAVVRNRPLLWFTAMFGSSGLGAGIAWGLIYFYIDGYLGLGAKFAGLILLTIPIGIVATPVWGWLCRRFSKQWAWSAGCVGSALACLSYALIRPGEGAWTHLAATLVFFNAVIVVEAVAGPAMLADVVDYGRWRFDADYAGTYFAFYTMVQKINVGIGAAIGLAVAGFFGFDATVAEQTPRGVFGLMLGVAWLPAVTYLIAAVLIWNFPITRKKQRAIVHAIERREARRRLATAATAAEVSP